MPFGSTGFGGIASVGYTTVDKDKYDFNSDDNYVDWKAYRCDLWFQICFGFNSWIGAIGTNIDTDGMSHAGERAVETGAVFTLAKSF